MTAYELPASEWGRLAGTELAAFATWDQPPGMRVLVVEDDGAIVGCWSLLPVWHVEGLWIKADARCKSCVGRWLLTTMRKWIGDVGATRVVTASMSEEISGYLTRVGATALPGTAYVWPMKESRCLPLS